jgi:hypothetical protein
LKYEGFCILSTKKNNLALHVYKKTKRKDENIISSIGEKSGSFLLLSGYLLLFLFSPFLFI